MPALKNLQEQIALLKQENQDLKNLLTNLTEATNLKEHHELSWIYALQGNQDGVWDWNAVTNTVYFSKRWKEMLGYQEHEIANTLGEWDSRLHPEDRDRVYGDLKRHLDGKDPFYQNEHRLRCKDGSYRWILDRGRVMSWTKDYKPLRVVGTHTDINKRKLIELENTRLSNEIKQAVENIKTLNGLLPICAYCKKIRDDKGYWRQIEQYISEHSNADFTHSVCPTCRDKFLAES